MDATDTALVKQVLSGDKAAFGWLVERYRPTALRLASRMLGDREEAEDITQEACLQAFLSLDRLREPERFAAWLYGIVVNLGRMRLRARRDAVSVEDLDGGRVAPGFTWAETQPTPEAAYEIRELHQVVLRAVELLPPKQQAAVRLHYLDGLTLTEIGVLAGSPLGTVKARLHRARERLRAELAGEFAGRKTQTSQKEEARMIEVVVHDIVVRMRKGEDRPGVEQYRVVLLKEREGDRILPMWIGAWEADGIALQLAEKSPTRPLTFDLMARLLQATRVTVDRVAVTHLHEDVFYATLWVRGDGQTHEIDARPSDALNLALRVKAPIFVVEDVIEACGTKTDAVWEKLEAAAWKGHEAERVPLEEAGMEWRSVPVPEFTILPAAPP